MVEVELDLPLPWRMVTNSAIKRSFEEACLEMEQVTGAQRDFSRQACSCHQWANRALPTGLLVQQLPEAAGGGAKPVINALDDR